MKWCNQLIEFCNLAILFCVTTVLGTIVLLYGCSPYRPIILILQLFLILISYIYLIFIHNLFLLTLSHGLIMCLLFFLPITILEKIMIVLLFSYLTFYNIKNVFLHTEKGCISIPFSFGLPIFIILYIVCGKSDYIYMRPIIYYCGMIFLTISILKLYLTNLNKSPYLSDYSSNEYTRRVIFQNNILVFTMLALIIAITCTLSFSFLEQILNVILLGINQLLRFIVQILFKSKSSPPEALITPPATTSEITPATPFIPSKPSELALFLDHIISFIFYILIIVCLIYFLYRLIKKVIALYHSSTAIKSTETSEFDVIETTKKIKTPNRSTPLFHFFNQPRDKIRRSYYRTIYSFIRHGYHNKPSDTPNERAADIQQQKHQNIDELTAQYNRARYGEQD